MGTEKPIAPLTKKEGLNKSRFKERAIRFSFIGTLYLYTYIDTVQIVCELLATYLPSSFSLVFNE